MDRALNCQPEQYEQPRKMVVKICVYTKHADNGDKYLISAFVVEHELVKGSVVMNKDGRPRTDGCRIITMGDCDMSSTMSSFFPWEVTSTLTKWEEYLKTLGFEFSMTIPRHYLRSYIYVSENSNKFKNDLYKIINIIKLTKQFM